VPTPLADRVRELALEAAVERQELERRRAELNAARDEEIEAIRQRHITESRREMEEVRQRYAGERETIDSELKTIARLSRALSDKPRQTRKKPGAPSQKWRPSPEAFAAVMHAMDAGAETITQISGHEAVSVSTTTIKLALDHMRDESHVRLAGMTGGKANARRYKLTPQGREAMNATNGRVTVESQA
jgi:hypothetical protein